MSIHEPITYMFNVALLLQDMFLTFLTWLGLVLGQRRLNLPFANKSNTKLNLTEMRLFFWERKQVGRTLAYQQKEITQRKGLVEIKIKWRSKINWLQPRKHLLHFTNRSFLPQCEEQRNHQTFPERSSLHSGDETLQSPWGSPTQVYNWKELKTS